MEKRIENIVWLDGVVVVVVFPLSFIHFLLFFVSTSNRMDLDIKVLLDRQPYRKWNTSPNEFFLLGDFPAIGSNFLAL